MSYKSPKNNIYQSIKSNKQLHFFNKIKLSNIKFERLLFSLSTTF
jgi:hypothetical protein